MKQCPIGVFDSGLGGLTAVKQLCSLLPQENIVYFGDTGRVPYGTRSREIIRKYSAQDFAFLTSQGVKMIIIACGTVSSVAADIGESLTIPFTGVVHPTAQAAVKASRSGKIGVIATTATIRSGSFRKELLSIAPETQVFTQDCPLFVPLVENGFVDENNQVTRLVAEQYLAPMKAAGVDTLILGCTHYPILAPILQKIMGDSVTLIDSGREAALWTKQILQERDLLNDSAVEGTRRFYVSDSGENFASVGAMFLGHSLDGMVSRVDIETY